MPVPRFFIYPIVPLIGLVATLRHLSLSTWTSPEWQVKKRERMEDAREEQQLRAIAGLPPAPEHHGGQMHPFRYHFDDGKANAAHSH